MSKVMYHTEPFSFPLVIQTRPAMEMTEEQFFKFCQQNPDLHIERTAEGDLEVMPPAGGSTGSGNIRLAHTFVTWSDEEGTGMCFDSSTGFVLPNGATRSPDVAWVKQGRLDALTDDEWKRFLPLCPDFVLELRSPSDSLAALQGKMEEYLENGAQLGWLLDPLTQSVYVYRPNQPVECLENPETVSGEPVLSGLVLPLQKVWNAIHRIK